MLFFSWGRRKTHTNDFLLPISVFLSSRLAVSLSADQAHLLQLITLAFDTRKLVLHLPLSLLLPHVVKLPALLHFHHGRLTTMDIPYIAACGAHAPHTLPSFFPDYSSRG